MIAGLETADEGEIQLVARLGSRLPDGPREGAAVAVKTNPDEGHFFDPESGASLGHFS